MRKQKKQSVFSKLKPYTEGKRHLIPAALVLSALSAVFNMVPLIMIWAIVSEVLTHSEKLNKAAIYNDAFLAVIFVILSIAAYYGALMASHIAAFSVETKMKKEGMRRLLNMPLGFFNEKTSGKLRNIIMDGAGKTHVLLAHQMPDLAGTIVSPILLFIFILFFDWQLGLVSLLPIICGILLMGKMTTQEGKVFQKRYMDQLEVMSSESVEYVRGIPVVKTFGQSVYAFKRFYGSIMDYKDLVMQYTLLWTNPFSLYNVIIVSAAYFIIPFAFLILTADNMVYIITNVVLYLLIAPMFSVYIMRSMYFTQQLNVATEAIDRYNRAFDYANLPKGKGAVSRTHDVEFKRVSFSYPGSEKKAINNVSFTLKEGQTLALVGASGSGKTTIARLASRFWDVNEGEILIGGVNVKDYTKEELMQKIAFVFQNNRLFKTSLRENIIYGNENATEAEIENAICLSQSKAIIDGLENGLDTVIGTKGTYLSGGEQQRIAIARAIVKNAPIVLLDEATAFCDPENEHLIKKALHELSKGKTTIMIAHRLSTVKSADMIAVVDKGEIIERGSFDELIAKDGKFTSMWQEYQTTIDWKIDAQKGANHA